MKTISITFMSFVCTLAFSLSALAVEDSANAEKARARQYNGGADEEDLKVQQLPAKDQKSKTTVDPEASEGF